MTIDQMIADLKAKFSNQAKSIEGWRDEFTKAFGIGGPNLQTAYDACLGSWKKATFPKPNDMKAHLGKRLEPNQADNPYDFDKFYDSRWKWVEMPSDDPRYRGRMRRVWIGQGPKPSWANEAYDGPDPAMEPQSHWSDR